MHVAHQHRLLLLRRGAAHAPSEADLLARRPALEGAEDEDVCFRGRGCGRGPEDGEFVLSDVEAGPVYGGGGGGEGGVGVPEEGGDVGEVALED